MVASGWDTYMLGNLGYSAVNCESVLKNSGNFQMKCDVGTIGAILDYGIVLKTASTGIMDVCINNSETLECKPDHPNFIKLFQSSSGKSASTIETEGV